MIEANKLTVKHNSGGVVLTALDSISLRIGEGEYAAILGPNGSGKSTLLKALCGLVPIESGTVSIFGAEVAYGSFSERFFGRIGVVFQEPEGQFVMRDVAAEIGAVLQNTGIPYAEQQRRFEQAVEQFDLRQLLDRKPEKLSGGQMQIVNLACAVASGAQLLFLDEPTTFLDSAWREKFLSLIDGLHRNGATIVHITQYSDEAIRAKRVCFLDRGVLVYDGEPARLFEDINLTSKHKLAPPIGRRFSLAFGFDIDDVNKTAAMGAGADSGQRELNFAERKDVPVASVSRMKFAYPNINFPLYVEDLQLYQEEVVGLIGPTGAGKSTLAFLLAGLLKPNEGEITVGGRPVEGYNSAELRREIGLSWQIADMAMIGPTVEEDIRLSIGDKPVESSRILEMVGLGGFQDRIVDTLSGGEKRKLSLASALAVDPKLLILDEPSAFLDHDSQLELIGILRKIAGQGHGIIIIGHDLPFISELADRVLGMKDGKICLDLQAREFFSDPSYLEKLGLPPDPVINFRHSLTRHGISLPNGSLNLEGMAARLTVKAKNLRRDSPA